jgi:hypothetical protein
MGDVPMISTADDECSPMHFNTTASSSAYKGALSVENSWFHWNHRNPLLIVVISVTIGAEYNKVFRSPLSQKEKKKNRGLKSGDRAGQWTGPPRPIHCSPKVWFMCCLTLRRKCVGAIMHKPHVLLMKRHIFQEY